jgi:glutamate---cysteine ligase / carboxylate-amine ligase
MDAISPEAFTFGIEEEFFLIDRRTRHAAPRVPKRFVKTCQSRLGQNVTFELQQTQVEIVSPIFTDPTQAREEMSRLRAGVAGIAESMGLAIVAAGTLPLANWRRQRHTDKPRYARLIDTFQMIGRRDVMCGLHIHVAVPEGDRVQLMNRLMPWLPLFLALSTSSPFWNLSRTGLLSYRQSAIDEWPRAGIPDFFVDQADYDAFIARLVRAGAMRDGSELWWAIRPSPNYPTLELRISDSCTRVEDTIALATLFRCLVSAHMRYPELGARRSTATRRLIEENRWRAQRHGIEAQFIDEFGDGEVSVADLVAEALELTQPDARTLDPAGALGSLSTILARGTSAHAQLAHYDEARVAGADRIAALRDVVDWLTVTTCADQVPAAKVAQARIPAVPA